jgi:hypothetical protein
VNELPIEKLNPRWTVNIKKSLKGMGLEIEA